MAWTITNTAVTFESPITVRDRSQAWDIIHTMCFGGFAYDEVRSKRAGYPIYYTKRDNCCAYVCDLNDRFELNLPNGSSVNIWLV